MSSRTIRSLIPGLLLAVTACQNQITNPPLLAGKGGNPPPTPCLGVPEVLAITLTPASTVLNVGAAAPLTARNQDGVAIPACALKWSSSNSAIAMVGSDGVLLGKAMGGPVTIKAQTGGKKPIQGRAEVVVDGWVDVDADNEVACGLRYTGRLYCWGSNGGSDPGGVGQGFYGGNFPAPAEVVGARTWSAFSSGYPGTCAISTQGTAYCWGGNYGGYLGVGKTYEELAWSVSPVEVSGGLTWRSISYGSGLVCGITDTGSAYCWGENNAGQLGDGTTTGRTVPTPVAGGHVFVSIKTGAEAACGRTNLGEELCWGNIDDLHRYNVPTPVPNATGLSDLTPLYWGITCGRDASSTAYCWGRNTGMGTLGTGPVSGWGLADPTPVAGGQKWSSIASGLTPHGCGVSSSGEAWCWGNNYSGELGDGTTTTTDTPVKVAGVLVWKELAPSLGRWGRGQGSNSTCGLTTSGEIHCWGANGGGQLGNGSFAPSLVPVKVVDPVTP